MNTYPSHLAEYLNAESRRRCDSASGQLLVVFDVVSELGERLRLDVTSSGSGDTVLQWMPAIREVLAGLARTAGMADTADFVAAWQTLLLGMIVGDRCGNGDSRSSAKRAAEVMLAHWPRI